MQSPFKKELTPNFSKPEDLQAFILDTPNGAALLKKEIDVNRVEQQLLFQRISMMETRINEMPSYNPEYSTLLTQTQMDKIELDELKRREEIIVEQLNSFTYKKD